MNGCQHWISNAMKEIKEKQDNKQNIADAKTFHSLMLPNDDLTEEHVIYSVGKQSNIKLPEKVRTQIFYPCRKLNYLFKSKSNAMKEHKHIYFNMFIVLKNDVRQMTLMNQVGG